MKNIALAFLCIFYAHITFAQKAIIKVITETAPYSKEKYVFPVIRIPGNKKAENKINRKLQEEVLWLDSSGYKQSLFENVWELKGESDGRWVYTDFEYNVLSNESNYTSLTISYVGGRYAQTNTYKFSFDNSTGEEVNLEKLFTAEGKKKIFDTIRSGQNKRIKKEITALRDSMKNSMEARLAREKNFYNEYIEDTEEAIRINTNCMERSRTMDFDYYEFYIKKGNLFIEGEGCVGSRNDQRIGVLDNYVFSIPIKKLEPYLSVYGKKILIIHH